MHSLHSYSINQSINQSNQSINQSIKYLTYKVLTLITTTLSTVLTIDLSATFHVIFGTVNYSKSGSTLSTTPSSATNSLPHYHASNDCRRLKFGPYGTGPTPLYRVSACVDDVICRQQNSASAIQGLPFSCSTCPVWVPTKICLWPHIVCLVYGKNRRNRCSAWALVPSVCRRLPNLGRHVSK